jgi:hypothetical protein
MRNTRLQNVLVQEVNDLQEEAEIPEDDEQKCRA